MKKQFNIDFMSKNFVVKDYIICDNLFSQMRGLMFRPRNFDKSLLFIWKKPVKISIHSFFVRQTFVAVWMNNGKILEKQLVKPWRIAVTPKEKFDSLLEIPLINM